MILAIYSFFFSTAAKFLRTESVKCPAHAVIDSFHIVSAHAPNCLVLRYLCEITLGGATFIRLPIHYTMEYGKDEKKNKFANYSKN